MTIFKRTFVFCIFFHPLLSPLFTFYIYIPKPDPNLKFNEETKNYDYSPIDWDEFWNVVKGNGPGNKLRINHHIKAHEDGKWVREAAKAYSKKINLSKKIA